MKSFEGSFCNLNFSPSTSILLNFFFPFIDIRCFFCQVLQYSRTIVLLKKLNPLKKPFFQKRRWSCDFPPRKKPVAQISTARFLAKKRWHSLPPPSGCLGTPLPLPQSLCGRISRIDRLPNLLSNGAPLAGFAHRLRYNTIQYSKTQYHTVQYSAIQYSTTGH